MTEDSINADVSIRYNRGVALADFTYAITGMSGERSATTAVGPSYVHIPSRPTAGNVTITRENRGKTINFTDGKWKNVPIFKGSIHSTDDSKLNLYENVDFTDLMSIPLVYFSGGFNQADTDVEEMVKPFGRTVDTDTVSNAVDINQYMWWKLRKVGCHLTNFLVQIERDTSGGVQWKDEPIFQIRSVPLTGTHEMLPMMEDGNVGYFGPFDNLATLIYMGNLNDRGLHMELNINAGWTTRAAHLHTTKDGKSYYSPNLMQWFSYYYLQKYPADAWRREPVANPQLMDVPYSLQIRCINIPSNVNNITASLSYMRTLYGEWDVCGRLWWPLSATSDPVPIQEIKNYYASKVDTDKGSVSLEEKRVLKKLRVAAEQNSD